VSSISCNVADAARSFVARLHFAFDAPRTLSRRYMVLVSGSGRCLRSVSRGIKNAQPQLRPLSHLPPPTVAHYYCSPPALSFTCRSLPFSTIPLLSHTAPPRTLTLYLQPLPLGTLDAALRHARQAARDGTCAAAPPWRSALRQYHFLQRTNVAVYAASTRTRARRKTMRGQIGLGSSAIFMVKNHLCFPLFTHRVKILRAVLLAYAAHSKRFRARGAGRGCLLLCLAHHFYVFSFLNNAGALLSASACCLQRLQLPFYRHLLIYIISVGLVC